MSPVVPSTVPAAAPVRSTNRSRGQVLILYVMAVFVFMGMLAVVLDISWYWINSNRVQKAADAAALAGVVWLPGDEPKAIQTAIYEAAKNGYTVAANGVAVNGLTLTAGKAAGNDRRLNVSIRAPVGTFFMRLFGLPSDPGAAIRARRVCPPRRDGEPRELLRRVRSGPQRDHDDDHHAASDGGDHSRLRSERVGTDPPGSPGTAGWTFTSGTLVSAVRTEDTSYARTSTANAIQQWGNFGLTAGDPGQLRRQPQLRDDHRWRRRHPR